MEKVLLEESIDFTIKFAQKFNIEFVESAALLLNKKRIVTMIARVFGLPSQVIETSHDTWLLVRIVKDSRLLEASVNVDVDFKNRIPRVIEKMLTFSKGYGKPIHSDWLRLAPKSSNSERIERESPDSNSLEEKMEGYKETVLKLGEDSQRTFVNLTQISETFLYGNQNDARLQHKSFGFALTVGAMVSKDAKSILRYSSSDTSAIVSTEIVDDAQLLFRGFSGAKKADLSNIEEVVLDPCLAGLTLHMACHHSAPPKHKVTASSIRVLDDPLCLGAFHGYFFDDEGTKAQATLLIDEQGHRHEILDRFAARGVHKPTGHYRRWPQTFRPHLSLSHTHVEGGHCSDDEIFEIGKGIYARGYRDFWEDNEKILHVIPREAFSIQGKDITHPLPKVHLLFDVQNLVSNVTLAGNTTIHSYRLLDCPYCHEDISVCAPKIRMKGVKVQYVE